jgi:hypothetical protein
MEKTPHGRLRMHDPNRPSTYAQQDRAQPKEVYIDNDSGYSVYVGPNGRTHIFTDAGKYHTSFITTRRNRLSRIAKGKWTRQAI